YYQGQRSPLVHGPLTGLVIYRDGAWRVSSQNLCQLSSIESIPCIQLAGEDPSSIVLPPEGWSRPDTEPEAVRAFTALADPAATIEQRIAAVEDGETLHDVVAAGLAADATRAGHVTFEAVGARF